MRSLLSSLESHPLAMLRGIAEQRGLPLTTNNRSEAAAQLAANLAEPAATATALADCSPEARAAWAALVSAGGKMKLPAFTRSAGQFRPVGPGRLEREALWSAPQSPAEELWYRGLIFRAFADLGDGPVEYVYIPDDLLAGARAAAREPGAGPSQTSPPGTLQAPRAVGPPSEEVRSFNSLAVDICALLAELRARPARLDMHGAVPPPEASRLQEGWVLQDATRLELAVALARHHGWLVGERGRLTTNPEASAPWLRATHWEQMSALFHAWRDSMDRQPAGQGWDDLRHTPGLLAEGTWQNDPSLPRRMILDALRLLDPKAWYAVSDLVAWIKATWPDFARPDGDYRSWYLRDARTGRYLSGFESWDEVEGRLIRFLLTGPLFWLDVVSLSHGKNGHATAFRVTPSGAAWLNDGTPPELPRPARLIVHGDFTVSAPLWVPLIDRARLLRFTDPLPEQTGLGQPTRHRITRGSLARARAAGLSARGILQFLRRASGGQLPGRVAAGLQRWGQHRGVVRITMGAVLRVDDAHTLAVLRSDPHVAPLLGDLISAQAVLVSAANLPALLEVLDALGYSVQTA